MTKTPYRRGAEDGLKFGIYLTVLLFACFFSGKAVLLGVVFIGMAVAVPFLVYRMLSDYHNELGREAGFSMLWMQGLMIFACGSMIAGGILMVYLRWIDPDYMLNQLKILASLDTSGEYAALADTSAMAQNLIDNKFVPRAVDVVVEIILLAITTGSLLSMLLSAIIVRGDGRPVNRNLNSTK